MALHLTVSVTHSTLFILKGLLTSLPPVFMIHQYCKANEHGLYAFTGNGHGVLGIVLTWYHQRNEMEVCGERRWVWGMKRIARDGQGVCGRVGKVWGGKRWVGVGDWGNGDSLGVLERTSAVKDEGFRVGGACGRCVWKEEVAPVCQSTGMEWLSLAVWA